MKFARLKTVEGEALPQIPWNVYPRPQMKRDSFFCLNGKWEFEVSKEKEIPKAVKKKVWERDNHKCIFCKKKCKSA